MTKELNILKGIHPGFVLERKIQEQGLKKNELAQRINEYPQTLTAITKGKRDMNTALALKLENALELEEGYFMLLQIYYDIKKLKQQQEQKGPNMKKLRRVLFWDTNPASIEWQRQYRAVIRRVFERGNTAEKKEIIRFYGKEKVDQALKNS